MPDSLPSTPGAPAEAARQQLAALVRDAPAGLASLAGAAHLVTVTNQLFRQLFGGRLLVGLRLGEALPELAGQPFLALLDEAYRTGATCYGYEAVAFEDATRAAPRGPVYFTFLAQPVRDAAGAVSGLLLSAYNVSAYVLARPLAGALPASTAQQLATANEQLAVANEELDVTNEELRVSNEDLRLSNEQLLVANNQLRVYNEEIRTQADELRRAEQKVQQLNDELTLTNAGLVDTIIDSLRATEFARADAEAQRLRLHQLVAEAPAMIAVLTGSNHVVELANDNFRGMLGHRELVGRSFRRAVPELASQPFFDLLNQVYRTGETYTGIDLPVTLNRTRPGQPEHLFVACTFQATRDETGRITGLLLFAYEVTAQVLVRQEREAARAEIERQQQQLHDLFMAAPGPIVILAGPALVFELVNPAYQQIFPGRELFGKPLLDALPELTHTAIPELCHQVYTTGETYVAEEMPLQMARQPGGPLQEIYWTFTYQSRRNAQGAVDGVVVFAYDVTSPVQARQAVEARQQQVQALNQQLATHNADLSNTNEELLVSNEALGDTNQQLVRTNVDLDSFVYTASHDLQGPLNNLDGLLQALHEELPPASQSAPVAHILELLHDSVERFQHTLTHLSAIAHVQAEASQPAPAVLLADVVRDVLLDLALPIAEAGAQLTVDVADCPAIAFSEKNLRSVVYNLVSNAIKYCHPDRRPQVRIQCRTEPGYWVLSVQDNGLGLDLLSGRPLFGLFQRFHTHVEGSGVGLYLAKRIVEHTGGRIEVASQLGVGSTFTVYFKRG
ncbi:MAG: PAS domain-containing protein [Janthinobacterium lividum]